MARNERSNIKMKSTEGLSNEGLVYAKMCLECSRDCKIMILPNATLIKCPDFSEKKKI